MAQVGLHQSGYIYLAFLCLIFHTLVSGSAPKAFDIRLAGSRLDSQGRVEVFYGGQWGTVSSPGNWTRNEVGALCGQLDYHGTNMGAFPFGYFARGEGPVQLTLLRCPARASHLASCEYQISTPDSGLSHTDDAALFCDGYLQLADGHADQNGVIKILVEGYAFVLCTNIWTQANSDVACQGLGYAYGTATMLAQYVSKLFSVDRLDFDCKGTEPALEQCHRHQIDSDVPCHAMWLSCSDPTTDNNTSQNADGSFTFTMSTILGSLVFTIIMVMLLMAYVLTLKKQSMDRHRRWITLPGGRQQYRLRSNDRRRRRRGAASNRRQTPTVNSISNGQRGNDRDLPSYSRLEEDTPPPYSTFPQPPIEIPVVGREERYNDGQTPRCTEIDAFDYFTELNAEQLLVRSQEASGELEQQEQPQQVGITQGSITAVSTQLDSMHTGNPVADDGMQTIVVDGSLETESAGSDMQGGRMMPEGFLQGYDADNNIKESGFVPYAPKQTINIGSCGTSVEV